jgi:hypothetical protein
VGPKRTEKEKEKKKENVGAPYNMWQVKQQVKLDYFWRPEETQNEVFKLF